MEKKANEALINTFCEITSSSKSQALFFLESHNFDLDSAVSTFLENSSLPSAGPGTAVVATDPVSPSDSQSYSPSHSESSSPSSRSRSPSPPPPPSLSSKRLRKPSSNAYNLRSSRPRNDAAAADVADAVGGGRRNLRRRPSTGLESNSDEPQEASTGGEKSGMLVQDPSKENDVDALFNQARQCAAVEGPSEHLPSSGSRSFTGAARRLTEEAVPSVPQPPENATHAITFWRNGFTVDDGPPRSFDDPENASFLESIRKSECPKELEPADRKTHVHFNVTRSEEDCPVPEKRHVSFQGVRRTSGNTSNAVAVESTVVVSSFTADPAPSVGLVVDQTQPSTSIQVRLADGTRMVSRFNFQHSIRDIRGFIDASRPSGSRSYQLQTVGFPPKELSDLDQTIEQADLANSVVIQKL
ncbi:plant UBX domain-containing protein 4-like isoform X2 [Solanum tuberosum]|uniref:plant UBX domain-containing protein 4-like isoform X2 n=1 Tax=Solanum tuberosum TaxID=4113 RepID=UPI0003D24EE6|nr:PREDICTED: plant UBX domain-containing protein 4-like isoform X2 [Solanum tuberosum]